MEPVDSVYPDFRDLDGLYAEAVQGRKTGFTGKVAIHPDQVDVINRAFLPTDDEVAHAKRVIAAFDDVGGSGTVGGDQGICRANRMACKALKFPVISEDAVIVWELQDTALGGF